MKIALIGATGPTGQLVIEQALKRGHEVVAYVRNPGKLTARSGLTIVSGTLDYTAAFSAAIKGADAVFSTLGTQQLRNVTLMQNSLPLVIKAMQGAGVQRFVLMSAYGVGETARTASLLARFLYKTVTSSVFADKEQSEKLLTGSGLKWTGVYPVILTNGPLASSMDVKPLDKVTKVSGLPKVSRANVARAMLDAVENDGTIAQRLVVSASGTVR